MKFDLEYGRKSCPYDKLKVYDGSDAKATLKGTYCGNKKPKDDIISKGNTIFVTFSSDYSVVASGFRIRFSVGEKRFSVYTILRVSCVTMRIQYICLV